jgi:hypothetical protein
MAYENNKQVKLYTKFKIAFYPIKISNLIYIIFILLYFHSSITHFPSLHINISQFRFIHSIINPHPQYIILLIYNYTIFNLIISYSLLFHIIHSTLVLNITNMNIYFIIYIFLIINPMKVSIILTFILIATITTNPTFNLFNRLEKHVV